VLNELLNSIVTIQSEDVHIFIGSIERKDSLDSYLFFLLLLLRFSYAACCDFLQNNQLLSIIRAHEAQDAG
jgi:hypothetical protein